MAAGKAIIVSDLPSMRQVLTPERERVAGAERRCRGICAIDRPIAHWIRSCVRGSEIRLKTLAQNFSWKRARSETILNFVNKSLEQHRLDFKYKVMEDTMIATNTGQTIPFLLLNQTPVRAVSTGFVFRIMSGHGWFQTFMAMAPSSRATECRRSMSRTIAGARLATAARLVLMVLPIRRWDVTKSLAIEWNGFTFVQPDLLEPLPQIMLLTCEIHGARNSKISKTKLWWTSGLSSVIQALPTL